MYVEYHCMVVYRGVPRGVLRVLEHPHQENQLFNYYIITVTATREEATHTATDLQLASNSYTHTLSSIVN